MSYPTISYKILHTARAQPPAYCYSMVCQGWFLRQPSRNPVRASSKHPGKQTDGAPLHHDLLDTWRREKWVREISTSPPKSTAITTSCPALHRACILMSAVGLCFVGGNSYER
jgi:hypothetical protein